MTHAEADHESRDGGMDENALQYIGCGDPMCSSGRRCEMVFELQLSSQPRLLDVPRPVGSADSETHHVIGRSHLESTICGWSNQLLRAGAVLWGDCDWVRASSL